MLTIDWNWVKKEAVRRERIKNAAIRKAFREALKEARGLARPKAVSTTIDIPSLKFKSGKLAHYLRCAEEARVFLVTIGPRLERAATEHMSSGDALGGYFLDKIGSLAAESLAESFEKDLRKAMARKKRSVSSRFSPGYCDWPIEEQFGLDRILKFRKAGVRLTRSCMMVPRKSISGILGIGPEGAYTKTGSLCAKCDKKDCSYRRTF